MRRLAALLLSMILSAGLLTVPAVAQPPGGLIEIGANQASVDEPSVDITPDGSQVLLVSNGDLTPSASAGGGDSDYHVFVYDVASGAYEQIDVLANGRSSDGAGDGVELEAEISADGRYVLFVHDAGDLDPTTPVDNFNGGGLLYLRDRQTSTTTLISVTEDGQPYAVDSLNRAGIALAGDASALAYTTVVDPFGFCGGNANAVYYYVVSTGQHLLASADSEGCIAQQGDSGNPTLSADGRFLAFDSSMAEVNGVDGGGVSNIWLLDASDGSTRRLTDTATSDAAEPELSADGSRVAFTTQEGYDAGDTDLIEDVYVLEVASGQTTLVSAGGDEFAGAPDISASGQYVAFYSESELVGPQPDPSDGNDANQGMYRVDLASGQTIRLDLLEDGSIPRTSVFLGDDVTVADNGTTAFTGDVDEIAAGLGGTYLSQDTGVAPPPSPPVNGLDAAIATAVEVSQTRFGSEGLHGGPADYGVLATVENFADALSGAVLTQQGPLLLTRSESLDPTTLAEFDRVLSGSGTIYVLGGGAAISAAVEQALTDAGYTVRRLAGASRFETSTIIAQEALTVLGGNGDVALARAFGPDGNPTAAWADSVTGGGWAADTGTPIVLTTSDGVHPAVRTFLDATQPTTTHLLGGEAALSAAVAAEVPGARRTAGQTRFDTARQIGLQLWGRAEEGARGYLIVDATAELGWAYGLPASGLAADTNAPILAVGSTAPPETLEAVAGCDDQVVTVGIGPLVASVLAELRAQDDQACG